MKKVLVLVVGLLLAIGSASAQSSVAMFGFSIPDSSGKLVEMVFAFHSSGVAIVDTVVKDNGVEIAHEEDTVQFDFEGSSHARTWMVKRSVGVFLVIEYLENDRVEFHGILNSGTEIAAQGLKVL